MVILTVVRRDGEEMVIGMGRYLVNEERHTAEVAVAVADDQQNLGVGTEILSYLKQIARRRGLLGFTAHVTQENASMLHLIEKIGFDMRGKVVQGVYLLDMHFKT